MEETNEMTLEAWATEQRLALHTVRHMQSLHQLEPHSKGTPEEFQALLDATFNARI
jgi:hypothetical protein